MDSAQRLLKLLALLQGRIDWTADELASRLEVTPRTVRRDITRLRHLGYPVEAMAGPGGGYRLGAGGSMPPLLLDNDEALAVALGLRLASTSAVSGLEEVAVMAMSKLEQVLPPRLREQLEDILESTVAVPAKSVQADPAVLALASSAARSRTRLRFDYRTAGGEESERHVEPLRLVYLGRRWYLVAFDLDRDDWRNFRLDRISECRATGMRSARRSAPDPVEMVQSGVTIEAYSIRAEATLSAPIDVVRRIIPPSVGSLEEVDEEVTRLVIGGDDTEWLARYLLQLPFPVEVVGPEELRAKLVEIGRGLISRYG